MDSTYNHIEALIPVRHPERKNKLLKVTFNLQSDFLDQTKKESISSDSNRDRISNSSNKNKAKKTYLSINLKPNSDETNPRNFFQSIGDLKQVQREKSSNINNSKCVFEETISHIRKQREINEKFSLQNTIQDGSWSKRRTKNKRLIDNEDFGEEKGDFNFLDQMNLSKTNNYSKMSKTNAFSMNNEMNSSLYLKQQNKKNMSESAMLKTLTPVKDSKFFNDYPKKNASLNEKNQLIVVSPLKQTFYDKNTDFFLKTFNKIGLQKDLVENKLFFEERPKSANKNTFQTIECPIHKQGL